MIEPGAERAQRAGRARDVLRERARRRRGRRGGRRRGRRRRIVVPAAGRASRSGSTSARSRRSRSRSSTARWCRSCRSAPSCRRRRRWSEIELPLERRDRAADPGVAAGGFGLVVVVVASWSSWWSWSSSEAACRRVLRAGRATPFRQYMRTELPTAKPLVDGEAGPIVQVSEALPSSPPLVTGIEPRASERGDRAADPGVACLGRSSGRRGRGRGRRRRRRGRAVVGALELEEHAVPCSTCGRPFRSRSRPATASPGRSCTSSSARRSSRAERRDRAVRVGDVRIVQVVVAGAPEGVPIETRTPLAADLHVVCRRRRRSARRAGRSCT